MAIQLVHYSDCGPVRASNQDAYCAFSANSPSGPFALLAVCDGMGGMSSGEVVSATVVHRFSNWFLSELPPLMQSNRVRPQEVLSSWNRALQECHCRLKQEAAARQIRWGSTLSLVLLSPDSYYLLHVGDSRAYLEDGASLHLLTRDQTLAMRELEAGNISPGQYDQDPRRNVLLQCIGDRSVSPVFRTGSRPARGALLVCSDGFYHTVQPEEMHLLLSRRTSRNELQQQVIELSDRARQLGETDNITAVALRWDGPSSAQGGTLDLSGESAVRPDGMDCVAKVVSIHAQPV